MSIKKLILIAMAGSIWLWGSQTQTPHSVKGVLAQVQTDRAVARMPEKMPEGVSGIVVHDYDESHSAIVSSAFVLGGEAASTRLKLVPYNGLKQPHLPEIETKPQKGDRVLIGYLYNRVLPIVPNESSYERLKKSFPKMQIIHPDLVAAELAKDKTPLPDRAHLQTTCEKFHLGLVAIMFSSGTDFLDCISWKIVGHSDDIRALDTDRFKQPFYHRFEKIPAPIYDWSDYRIDDYDRFYKKLEQTR